MKFNVNEKMAEISQKICEVPLIESQPAVSTNGQNNTGSGRSTPNRTRFASIYPKARRRGQGGGPPARPRPHNEVWKIFFLPVFKTPFFD